MSAIDGSGLTVGDHAYLVPATLGCPGACWSQPEVTVLKTTRGSAYLTVQLPSGNRLEVHERNVRLHRPTPPRETRRPRNPRQHAGLLPDSDEWTEVPLWSPET